VIVADSSADQIVEDVLNNLGTAHGTRMSLGHMK